MPEFSLPIPLPHSLGGHSTIPNEFWSPNFGLHPSLIPSNHSLMHPNVIPNYKLPNIHAILSQYMGLNNLFGYPQNLSVNSRISPQSSPKDSPTRDAEK